MPRLLISGDDQGTRVDILNESLLVAQSPVVSGGGAVDSVNTQAGAYVI